MEMIPLHIFKTKIIVILKQIFELLNRKKSITIGTSALFPPF